MKIMNILGIAVAAVGGYFIGKNHDKIWTKISSLRKPKMTKKNTEIFVEDKADIEVPTELISKSQNDFDVNIAKEEFVKKSFEGIYESIYRVAKGKSTKAIEVIADWNTRIHYLDGCPNVQKFWVSLFENYENFSPEQQEKSASDFMDFIFSTGIERDNRSQLIVDATTPFRYYASDDEEFINGQTMNIKFACWTLGDKILEKGILTTLP